MQGRGRRAAIRAALIALPLLLGPGAVAASADSLSVGLGRILVMAGTASNSTVTVGPGTPAAYRFTSTATITVNPSADPFCGPPGTTVECVDDATPPTPGDDIVSIRVDGGSGADTITVLGPLPTVAVVALAGGSGDGADSLTGGPGLDALAGGGGDDKLDGGAAADDISGEGGADTIEARDGEADRIRCGDGSDVVFADSVDTFPGADCESTTIDPQPPPPPPPPPPITLSGTTPPTPIAIGVGATFRISRLGTRVMRLTVKDIPAGVALRVTCTSPRRLSGGARCPFKKATVSVSKSRARLALAKRFKYRRLAPHTVIRIYGTSAGRVGTFVKFTIRKGRSPSRSDGCVSSKRKRISCLALNPG